LSELLETGEGGATDPIRAQKIKQRLLASAAQKCADDDEMSCLRLSAAYESGGYGFAKDPVKAETFSRRANEIILRRYTQSAASAAAQAP
jgi:hypothetical protein